MEACLASEKLREQPKFTRCVESSAEHEKGVEDKLTEVIGLLKNAAEKPLQTEPAKPGSIHNQVEMDNPGTTNYNGCGNIDRGGGRFRRNYRSGNAETSRE